jgi:hypothetical protein
MHYNVKKQDNLFEGLDHGDLARLVHSKLHIDEFKSKMGDDADILVLSFKVKEKSPAKDLSSFIERGYDWVLDADVSTGELDDGDYLVFVELERTPAAVEHIIKLVNDILNLSNQKIQDWSFQYQRKSTEYSINPKNIYNVVPLSANDYIKDYGEDKDELDSLKETARVKIKSAAPVNKFTESLRIAAGIK